MKWLVVSVALAAGIASAGCASKKPASKGEYQTVNADLRRDSERAKKENALAVKHIQAGNLELAEQALKSALAADVMHGPAHNNLGKVYFPFAAAIVAIPPKLKNV